MGKECIDYNGVFNNKNEHISQLIDAFDESEGIVIFVGAGLSKLCGLPLWGELTKKLLDKAYADGIISYDQKNDFLKNVNNEKILLSIIQNIYKEKEKETFFNKAINDCLKNNPKNEKEKRIVDSIIKLRANIITTNADKILDKCVIRDNNIYGKKFDKLDITKIGTRIFSDQPKIFHIHGSVKELDGRVFTVEEYIKTYNDKSFQKKMSVLLKQPDYPVLFIGTSMAELELLQYIFSEGESKSNKRFILAGFFSYQDFMINAYENYYKLFDITQITYSLDEKGHDLLINFLEDLSDHISKSTSLPSKIYNDLKKEIKTGVIKNITDDIIIHYHSLSHNLIKNLFLEVNKLKNAEKVYCKLYNRKSELFDINKIFIEDGIEREIFYQFRDVISDNSYYYKIADYYIKGILEYFVKNIKENDSHYFIMSSYLEICTKNNPNYDEEIIHFFEWLMSNNLSYVDEMLFALNGREISNKAAYLIGCKVLEHYLSNQSKYFNEETYSFFEQNAGKIKDYDPFDFVLKVYDCIKKVISKNGFQYMKMGALCDYCANKEFRDFKDYLIFLFCDISSSISNDDAIRMEKTIGHSIIDNKIKIQLIDNHFDEMKEYLFDSCFYSSLDYYSSLCLTFTHNKEKISSQFLERIRDKIKNSSFGSSKQNDIEALREKMLAIIDLRDPAKKGESFYEEVAYEDIGKKVRYKIVNTSEIEKEQFEIVKDMNYIEFIDYIKTNKFDFSFVASDVISHYYSNHNCMDELIKKPLIIEGVSKDLYYALLKPLMSDNALDRKEILDFLINSDKLEIDFQIIENIVEKNGLLCLYPSECYAFFKGLFDNYLIKDYGDLFGKETKTLDSLFGNPLFCVTGMLIQCGKMIGKETKPLFKIKSKSHNALIVKLAVISKYDLLDEEKEWFFTEIEKMLDTSNDIVRAEIYERLIDININIQSFVNKEYFVNAFPEMNLRAQKEYIFRCLICYNYVNDSTLSIICDNAESNDIRSAFDYLMNYPDYYSSKFSNMCKKAIEGKTIDVNLFIQLLKILENNNDDEIIKALCLKFCKSEQSYYFWDKIKLPIIEIVKKDQEYAINELIENLVCNYLKKFNFDYQNSMLGLFEQVLQLDISESGKEKIKLLSVAAFNKGLCGFEKLCNLKIKRSKK